MALFQYKAMNPSGRFAAGQMEAVNPADLELRLSRMGLDLIRSREVKRQVRGIGHKRITRQDLIAFLFHLEQLSQAGVPILDALSDLRDTMEHPRFREVIASLIEAIEGGAPLSDAMAAHPSVFDEVMVNLIRAGETSGELAAVLANLTATLKWQDEQIRQIKTLMIYPAVIAVVMTAVILFVMTYIVPQLVKVIETMGQDLPLHTRALIATSDFFVDYWYLVLALPVAVFAAIKYAVRVSPSFRYLVDDLKLRVWVLGPLLKKTILARFAHFFALMYGSGITVLECVRVSEEIVGNAAIREAINRAGSRIADGASISQSMEYAGLFPPLVLRMVRVGENTGALEEALTNVSYFYTRDVEDAVSRLQKAIEPTITLVLGAILGWVMLSVLGPLYDLIASVQL